MQGILTIATSAAQRLASAIDFFRSKKLAKVSLSDYWDSGCHFSDKTRFSFPYAAQSLPLHLKGVYHAHLNQQLSDVWQE
jgi:hypothetical protein